MGLKKGGVLDIRGEEADPVPPEFFATTEIQYVDPLESPVIEQLFFADVQLATVVPPLGEE